ncbi:AAA family ATPase [Methanosarcina hadiensis]|uniref:ATP-binding protein n=1 Tax=Methanosarcina hadiensis TaxID=3078083 RepID=UPI003977B36D
MTKVIAITGKGGTGKTAVSALLIRSLSRKGQFILAVDADADTNLPETLGCESVKTIGEAKEFLQAEITKPRPDNPDMNKESVLKSKVYEIIEEMPGYDLLVMGRPEGSGCYCYVNNLLRGIMDKLIVNYDVVIIDAEAGLEHFSRKIIRDIDDLIVVTDASRRGFRTAERIHELVNELDSKVGKIHVIANKVTDTNHEKLVKLADDLKLNLIGMVPLDPKIEEMDIKGIPLFEITDDSVAAIEVEKIVQKLGF